MWHSLGFLIKMRRFLFKWPWGVFQQYGGRQNTRDHYGDVKMSAMVSQITRLTIVYSAVYSGADQRKHQSSASQAFVMGIHRWPVNSRHKGPVTRKMFPFEDVIMDGSLHLTMLLLQHHIWRECWHSTLFRFIGICYAIMHQIFFIIRIIEYMWSQVNQLTHCGLVMPGSDKDLGQHLLG